ALPVSCAPSLPVADRDALSGGHSAPEALRATAVRPDGRRIVTPPAPPVKGWVCSGRNATRSGATTMPRRPPQTDRAAALVGRLGRSGGLQRRLQPLTGQAEGAGRSVPGAEAGRSAPDGRHPSGASRHARGSGPAVVA